MVPEIKSVEDLMEGFTPEENEEEQEENDDTEGEESAF